MKGEQRVATDAIEDPVQLFRELTERLEKVLASRRWRIGDFLVEAVRCLVGKQRRPTAADTIRRVVADFAAWESARQKHSRSADLTTEQLRRLGEWMRTLDEAFRALLVSRRWRIGCLVVDTVRVSFLRPSKLASVQILENLLDRCQRYRKSAEDAAKVPVLSLSEIYYRLGVVRENAGKWAAAAEAYEEASRLGETRPELFFHLGRVRARQKRWADAVRAYRKAIKQRPKNANWHFHLGEALEEHGRLVEADRAYVQAILVGPVRAKYLCSRAGISAKWKQWASAIELYEAAIRLEPSFAPAFFGLGRVREQLCVESPRYSAHTGLLLRMQGNWRAAADAYQRAIALDPTVPEYYFRLGHVREQMRDFRGATKGFEEAVRLKPRRAAWLYRLGRAREQALDLGGALSAYKALLREDPQRAKARGRIYTILVKLARWEEAAPYAFDEKKPNGLSVSADHTVRQLRDLLASPRFVSTQGEIVDLLTRSSEQGLCEAFPTNWWFALHWRLLNVGWYSLAYQAKDIAARVLLSEQEGKARSLTRHLAIGKALMQLGRKDDAIQHLSTVAPQGISDEEIDVAVNRLLSDIDAFYGDFARLRRGLSLHDGVNLPEAEEAFAELIEGRSVAIVGPVDNGLPNGEEIDSFDVVIRTNFLPDRMAAERAQRFGTRTDISYFNGVASKMLTSEIEAAVASGSLRMIVLRPFDFVANRLFVTRPGDLRYNPSESVVLLRARSFGIQRILHDVLRYVPARVKVFNMDFFLSRDSYNKGYKARELLADSDPFYVGSGHDYRGDFQFTKRLREVGLISGDEVVSRILDLSSPQYLRELDVDEEAEERVVLKQG